jgi:hypothetical protein
LIYTIFTFLQHVGVKADVVDVRTGAEQTTNDFRFTWCQERGKESAGLRHVVPKTYKGAFFAFRFFSFRGPSGSWFGTDAFLFFFFGW